MNQYSYAENGPINLTDSTGLTVRICSRDTHFGWGIDVITKIFKWKHQFLSTDTKAAGMGTIGCGPLPYPPPYGSPTQMCQVRNFGGAQCYAVKDVDEDCVNNELEYGKGTGNWTLKNQCNSLVESILKKCKKIDPKKAVCQ